VLRTDGAAGGARGAHGALTGLRELNLYRCSGLTALPAELGALTGLQTLDLRSCSRLTALPAELGALTGLQELYLLSCRALHTPPSRVVAAGTDALLAFLRDLGGGSAPCHLVKLVLLGERAGKSSLADSQGARAPGAAVPARHGLGAALWP
jgi:Leucine-rich repeat (LRR) protein